MITPIADPDEAPMNAATGLFESRYASGFEKMWFGGICASFILFTAIHLVPSGCITFHLDSTEQEGDATILLFQDVDETNVAGTTV